VFPLIAILAPAGFVLGSIVYCVMSIVAARQYRKVCAQPARERAQLSILKPLHGLDEGLDKNLRSYFRQNYLLPDGSPAFEILCATRNPQDPALDVVRGLQKEYPSVPCRIFQTGEPPYANAKVFSLDTMLGQARYDLLVMADSDVRVDPGFLDAINAEFQDASVGLVSCLYRAVPGRSVWSFLEALHMNTEFLGGVLTARMLEGVRFALGPTIAARRGVIAAVGGFDELKDYLAEDFVMGHRAAELGHGVLLSSAIIEHRIGSQNLASNLGHRLRWARSTRRSRPAGYFGEIFLRPLALACILTVIYPPAWPALIGVWLLRCWQALEMAATVHLRMTAKHWLLLPIQDLLSFVLWFAGFFGNSIWWRGRRYRLLPDGRFVLVNTGGA